MKSIAVLCGMALLVPFAAAQESRYKNLKVLTEEVANDHLSAIMLENLRGLGLRRLAGEGCLFCHVGDLETPRSKWDYASDAKPMKEKARVMMAMTDAINNKYLGSLESRTDAAFKVTCMTCHAGRVDPRPLPEVLWGVYEESGIDGVTARYGELRERYYAADAYDFRDRVLVGIALRMANAGAMNDAIVLAALNAKLGGEAPGARRAWVQLVLERTIDRKGVDAALVELSALEGSLAPDVVTPGLLDGLAWRLNRSERRKQGHALIAANHAKFPAEYVPLESLAFVLADTDRLAEALDLLNAWIETHPEHARARRLVVNLQSED